MYSKNDYRYYLENQLAHSDDFLAHYGVKGMKWKNHKKTSNIEVNHFDTKEEAQQYINSQRKKKTPIKKRISNIRKKYGLYREKPKGKKLKGGGNIYVSHS